MKKLIYTILAITLLCSCSNDMDEGFSSGKAPNISNYELHYTSKSGYTIEFGDDSFDAPIISNTYYLDKCVITFASPLTKISNLGSVDITSITIPSSVVEFDGNPFQYCEYLARFSSKYATSDGCALIMDKTLIAYARNSKRDSFTVPNKVTKIGDRAFYNCPSLKNINMHNNIIAIGLGAFEGCSSLEKIVFPRKLKSLPSHVCMNCSELQTVTLPDKLECECGVAPRCSKHNDWFSYCPQLEKFIGHNATADGRCLVINNIIHAFAPAYLDEYSIPNHIEAISQAAFAGSDRIEAIYIPSSVKYIGTAAFANCYNLYDIYCKATTPPAFEYSSFIGNSSPFYDLPYDFTIYVPKSSLNSYRDADGWNKFASHIVGYNF